MKKDYEYMQLTIEAMINSVDENRNDDKINPKVAALIVFPNGEYITACRGELREGNHAEFTLLERKLISRDCSKGVLYVTLEPCAPGARKHPKKACAEWIVSARIKTVYIGIEDPDPNVAGEGIAFLISKGIEVKSFTRDMQLRIQEANKDFLSQAINRTKKKVEDMDNKLNLKNFITFPIDSLSIEALSLFSKKIGFDFKKDYDSVINRLEELKLIRKTDEVQEVSYNGVILFAKNPRAILPQVSINMLSNYLGGKHDVEYYEGPMILAMDKVMDWIKKQLPSVTTIGIQRSSDLILPENIIREAVVNAIIHRDYTIDGAKINIEVSPNKLEIKSPGAPSFPVTLEQLNSFNAPQFSRNPVLAYVFKLVGYAEEVRVGMKSFSEITKKYELPLPKYKYNAPTLDMSFSFDVVKAKKPENDLNTNELNIFNVLKDGKERSRREIVDELDEAIENKTATRALNRLIELNFIKTNGESSKSPNIKYLINSEN